MENNNTLLKIICYNIHSGKDFFMRPQINNIISFLKAQEAHIIGIQEINENNRRGYQISEIEKVLHMNSSFAPNVKIGRGYYGVAFFTVFRIIESKHILLPSFKEQRGLLHTTVGIRNRKLNLLNTHLGLRGAERKEQFRAIEKYIKTLNDPIIFMGDFNTDNPDLEINNPIDTAKTLKKEHIPTFIGINKRIDYVYISKSLKILNYDVIPVSFSDHYPMLVELLF